MYTPAICILVIGVVLLILNVVIFFGDYKESIAYPIRRKKLYWNGAIIFSTIGMIVLGTIYIFMINNQL